MKGETILFAAPRTWGSLWRESQQIMSRLAKDNRVFYFEPGRDVSGSALSELRRTLPSFLSVQSRQEHDNLIIIPTPTTLPLMRRRIPASVLKQIAPWIRQVNEWILIQHMQRTVKKFDIKTPVLWVSSPFDVDLVGKFNEKLVCYLNYDNIHDFTQNRRIRDFILHFDEQLSSKADVIFATSRVQCEERKRINPNTHFIPHGVDFELFNSALTISDPPPEDIARIPHPIIGFAGWLGHHIDVELLVRIAETFPGYSLVLVGPDELPESEHKQKLYTLPNVYFLGRKDHKDLPKYLRMYDVALMPWTLTGHIRAAYPMKLHEYLAAGRAAVATDLPELHPYGHVIRIAENHEAFLQGIRDMLSETDPEAVEARVTVARNNTWDHRIKEINLILDQLLREPVDVESSD